MDDALCHHGRCAVTGRDGRHGAVVVIGHIVKGRDIDTVQSGSGAEKIGLAPALAAGAAVELHQLHGDVLALAQADQIDEVGQGLGVVHGGAAGDDQRGQAGAVRGVEGDVGQVQHIEDGGKGHLVANGEGHNVIVGDGVAGFQGKKGHFRLTQLGLHVAPGSEHALAPDAGDIVHYAVEDTHTQVGHTDLVGIREAEGDAGVYRRLVLEDGVVFAAHVAGGLLHPGQDAFQSFIHGVVLSPPLPDGAWTGELFLVTVYFIRFCAVWQDPFYGQPKDAGQQEQPRAGGQRQVQAQDQQGGGGNGAHRIGHAVGGVGLGAERRQQPEEAAAVHRADRQQIQRPQDQVGAGEGGQGRPSGQGQQRPEQKIAAGAGGHGQQLAAVGQAVEVRHIQLRAGGGEGQAAGRRVERMEGQDVSQLVAQGGG